MWFLWRRRGSSLRHCAHQGPIEEIVCCCEIGIELRVRTGSVDILVQSSRELQHETPMHECADHLHCVRFRNLVLFNAEALEHEAQHERQYPPAYQAED